MNKKQINRDKKAIANKKIFSRFEPLLYVPAFTTVKDFPIYYRTFCQRITATRSTQLPNTLLQSRGSVATMEQYLGDQKTTNSLVQNSLTKPYRVKYKFEAQVFVSESKIRREILRTKNLKKTFENNSTKLKTKSSFT